MANEQPLSARNNFVRIFWMKRVSEAISYWVNGRKKKQEDTNKGPCIQIWQFFDKTDDKLLFLWIKALEGSLKEN